MKRPDTQVRARDSLPDYTLRLSDRARYVRLTVKPRDGLVVVVPRPMRGFDPTDLLRERREWIERASEREARPLRGGSPKGDRAGLGRSAAAGATLERAHPRRRSTLRSAPGAPGTMRTTS